MDSPRDKVQVSIRLPAEMCDAFDRIAEALERDRTWVMLRAFKQYLETDGADILAEAAGIAELERGESADFDDVLRDAGAIIAAAKERRATGPR
jgi:predicted transcriptional regulator